jgi:hypothetical protein
MCKHYRGIMESNNPEGSGKHICTAFPNGIPGEILSGRNEHSQSMLGQNSIEVYERASNYAEMEMFKPKRGF